MIFPDNMGEFLSIDETSLSQGELYTFVTNKNGRGKKKTLVASIKGTSSKDIVKVLSKLPLEKRESVKEVTLDMAKNMESAVKSSFTNADLVTDRFHVVRLAINALQHIRIKHRWEELDKENTAIGEAKKTGKKHKSKTFENGDTPKQLLARSRYILAKKDSLWTENQKIRADILFREYPIVLVAYKHIMEFRNIYENKTKSRASEMFKQWIIDSNQLGIKEFNTVSNTVHNNLDNILNFFNNRSTNAFAESFKSKNKLFRSNIRG